MCVCVLAAFGLGGCRSTVDAVMGTEPRGDIAALAWLTGSWVMVDDSSEEHWTGPGGRSPATPFGLVDSGDRRATFENPDHDFPQRIIYERRGNELTVRIEGVENDQPKSQEWSWRLSSLGAMP